MRKKANPDTETLVLLGAGAALGIVAILAWRAFSRGPVHGPVDIASEFDCGAKPTDIIPIYREVVRVSDGARVTIDVAHCFPRQVGRWAIDNGDFWCYLSPAAPEDRYETMSIRSWTWLNTRTGEIRRYGSSECWPKDPSVWRLLKNEFWCPVPPDPPWVPRVKEIPPSPLPGMPAPPPVKWKNTRTGEVREVEEGCQPADPSLWVRTDLTPTPQDDFYCFPIQPDTLVPQAFVGWKNVRTGETRFMTWNCRPIDPNLWVKT
jgi:hypothetical protein